MKKLTIGAGLVAVAVAVPFSMASSHREAPNIMLDPTADNTDVYAFTAADAPGALTVAANWIPFEDPAGGPNFYRFDDRARYYVNIDNTGDGRADVRYRFTFRTRVKNRGTFLNAGPTVTSIDDPDLNVTQTYDVARETLRRGRVRRVTSVGRGVPVAPNNVGPKTMPDYGALASQAVRTLRNGTKVFAGQRDDPFFVDLGATFDSVNLRVGTGNAGGGKDDLAGYSVHSIVLQVPEAQVTRNGQGVTAPNAPNAVVGVWSSTERRRLEVTNENFDREVIATNARSRAERARRDRRERGGVGGRTESRRTPATTAQGREGRAGTDGEFVQVSRLGNPLVNEVVIPFGRKDEFNRTTPDEDARRFGRHVVEPELAAVLNALFPGLNVPERNRTDIVTALLQGVPDLNRQVAGANAPAVDTLKLNLGVPPAATPNRFGVLANDVAGFPNGRRLDDDVVDIELRVVGGFLVDNKLPLGDGVDQNDKPFLTAFPYLAAPTSGFESQLKRSEPSHPPTPGQP